MKNYRINLTPLVYGMLCMLAILCCSINDATAQNRYSRSYIDYTYSWYNSGCNEGGTNEYTVHAAVWNDESSWCYSYNRQCDAEYDCQNNGNACDRTTSAGHDASRLYYWVYGWEDDTGNRNNYDSNGDDCFGERQCGPIYIYDYPINTWRTDVCDVGGDHRTAMRWHWGYVSINQPSAFSATTGCNNNYLNAISSNQGNVTWYWQGTNSNGTSTSNPSTSNYPITSNGTYYLRARGDRTGEWSSSRALSVSGVEFTAGTASAYGNGYWQHSAYNGSGTWSPSSGNYKGYYTTNAQSFNSLDRWCSTCSPGDANGSGGSAYQGCSIGADQHTVVSRRTGFDCGIYRLDMPNHDDNVRVIVNGTNVLQHDGCCDAHNNFWVGYLDGSSSIEVVHREGGGGSHQSLTLVEVTPGISGGSVTGGGTICSGGNLGSFGSSSTPFGGASSDVRYVRIQQNKNDYINLAEIRAYETGTGTNVAIGKSVSVSSTYNGNFPASELVDNIVNTNDNMWHSGGTGTGQWAEIDLGTTYNLSDIQIWNRSNCCYDRADNLILILKDGSGNEIYREYINANSGSGATPVTFDVPSSTLSYQWQSRPGTSGGYSNVSGATGLTYNPPALSTTTQYRRAAIDQCGNVGYSNTLTITVVADPTSPTLASASPSSGSNVCAGSTVSANLNGGSGGTGCSDQYRYSTNGGSSWTGYSSGANITVGAFGTTTIVQGRRLCSGNGCDGSGETYTTLASWSVNDVTNPTINCPANTSVNTNSGCTYVGGFGTATGNDNCGGVSISNNAGSSLGLGANVVVWTATDGSGNTKTCNQTVTVNDDDNPTITCPSNASRNTNSGCTYVGGFGSATGSDNCSYTISNNAPAALPLGNTTVTWTSTDGAGNSVSCNQNVTVSDDDAPSITCPATANVTTNVGCSYSGAIGNASATDNCGTATITNNAPTGPTASYPLGNSTVVWTATDAAGNSASCNQTISVTDDDNPTITCTNYSKGTNSGCTYVGAVASPAASDNCGTVTLSGNAPAAYPLGATTVTWTATDAAGNTATCNQIVTVIDDDNPTISCPATATVGTNSGCTYVGSIGTATTTDNCSSTVSNNAPASFGLGNTTVTWTATDGAGNSVSCNQTVTVNDDDAPVITCPAGGTTYTNTGCTYVGPIGTASATDNCGATVSSDAPSALPLGANVITWTATDATGNTDNCTQTVTILDGANPNAICQNVTVQLDASGNGSTTAAAVDNGSNDNCGIQSITLSQTAFDCDQVGGNAVTLTVTDNSGNVSTCTATVTVEDNVSPNAICQDITVQLDANGDASITTGQIDNGSNDACDIANLALDITDFDCSSVGGNVVTLTVTDDNGNSSICTATVTVEDNIDPVIVGGCPSDITTFNSAQNCNQLVSWDHPTTTDNCGIASTVFTSPGVVITDFGTTVGAFGLFSVGVSTVTYTVTDDNSNVSTCTFTITVEDNEDPVITGCPSDINIGTDLGLCGAQAFWTAPTASDNCPGVAMTVNGHFSGQTYPIGTTTVTYTATDNVGLTTTCSFNIVVADDEDPVVNCPADVTVTADAGVCEATGVALGMATTSDNCPGETVSNDAPAAFPVGSTTVTWTATDAKGNTSSCTQIVTVTDDEDPTISCPANLTQNTDANSCDAMVIYTVSGADNCAGEVIVQTAGLETGETFPLGTTTNTFVITDAAGNTATCSFDVTIEDNELPTAICQDVTVQLDAAGNGSTTAAAVDNGSNDACGIQSLSLSQTAFVCSEVGANTVTLTVTDNNSNVSTCTATVTVEDNVLPTAICQDVTVQLDASGNGSTTAAAVDNGSNDACGILSLSLSQTAFVCSEVGANTVTLTVTDNNSNVSTCTATVTVEDNVLPTAICQDVTVQLDASGNGSTTAAAVDNGSNDACGIQSLSLSQTAFVCGEVGANTVTLTVTDNNSNVSTCTATVTVEDNVLPTAICQDVTVQLDASGNGSTTAAAVDNGSNDACGIQSLSLSQTAFVCGEVGANTVTLTVTDNNSNVSTCTATVTVEDNVLPIAICQDITAELDINGNAVIVANDVDNGSNDACGIQSLSLDITAFDCSNVGANTVVLTVTDNNSNVSTCSAVVTVEDNISPDALCQDITVQLDANGQVSIVAANINNGSTDNCAGTTVVNNALPWINEINHVENGMDADNKVEVIYDASLDLNAYSLKLYIGDFTGSATLYNSMTLALLDANAVSIGGGLKLVVVDAQVALSMLSNDRAIAWGIFNGTAPIEIISWQGIDPTTVTTSDGFAVTHDVMYAEGETDVNSNKLAGYTIIAERCGTGSPSAVTNWTSVLNKPSSAGPNNHSLGATNGCQTITSTGGTAGLTLSIDKEDFVCSEVGANIVTLTITDPNSNSSTCTATVTVEDNVLPIAICQDVTVQLDASGNGSTTAAAVDNGSNDACGIQSLALSQTAFVCGEVGANTVTLTVTDNNSNVSTCTATVTVEDNVLPVAICQDVTVQLDASGNGSITAAAVDNGSNDACGIQSLSLSQTAFVCGEVGANTVTLTVTDNNSNVSTCTATVTVEDNVLPIAICQDVTVQLDASGNGSTTAAAVDNGSNDACGIQSLALSQTAFVCGEVGANIVTLTVTDNNSNVSTCTATVTVEDNVLPVAICQDVTVQLDASGNGSTTAAAVDNGSNDACGILSLSLSQTAFVCGEVGANTVTLTVTDNNSNVSTCTATVTVEDNVAPVATCQDVTVQLDASGNGSTTAAAVDNGSNDACGIQSLALSQTAFVCGEVGANTVTLTVTDNNSNVSTCTATVTVEDNVAPVATCQDVTVQLDATGNGSITTGDVNNGSSDACGIASITLDDTDFNCLDLEPTVVNSNDLFISEYIEGSSNNKCIEIFNNTGASINLGSNNYNILVYFNGSTSAGSSINLTGTLNHGETYVVCHSSAASIYTSQADLLTGSLAYNGDDAVVLRRNTTILDVFGRVGQDPGSQWSAGGNSTSEQTLIRNANVTEGNTANASGFPSLGTEWTQYPQNYSELGSHSVEGTVGPKTVTLTVTDNNNNVSTCTATVTVEDNVAPVAICQDVTVQLDASGDGSITTADIDNGSSDACGIESLSLDDTDFNCSNVGANTVTLTVTDNNDNVSTCTAIVTVEDNVLPVAICQDVTVQLDASGNGSTSANAVDDGSNDACGIQSLALSQTDFVCSEVGANSVTLTVTDNNNNVSTCTATVTVEDNVAPVASCQDVTVQLDAYGNASITTADINNGSSDACGIAGLSLDDSNFDCSDVAVEVTIADLFISQYIEGSGNNKCIEIFNGTGAPVDLGAGNYNLLIYFNGSTSPGQDIALSGVIAAGDVFVICNSSATSTFTALADQTTGSVNFNGDDAVVLEKGGSPIDIFGRIGQDPGAYWSGLGGITTQNQTLIRKASVTSGNIDNASNFPSLGTEWDELPEDDASGLGSHTVAGGGVLVTLTVTDNNNNVSTCTATVTVEDNVAPVAVCQDVTVQLDASGNGSTTAAAVDNGSNDACGIQSLALSQTDFVCSEVGANTVTLTVTDNNDNVSTCTATITVEDNVAPVAICQDVTVQLDASGNGSTTAAAVDNGSNDACGIQSLALSQTDFVCSEVGANTVTLTVTDNNDNVSTCTATVTVEDNVAPVAICQDVTVQLDASGNGSTTAAAVDNGSNDACGIQSLALSQTAFVCSEVGGNTVTLTVTDNNNNVSTCTATVTVEDNVTPVAICQDVTVQLDASGNGSTTAAAVDNGSNDACGIQSLALSQTAFVCSEVGANTVTLTVTDNNNNVSTCTATVTVEDNVAPVAICQDVTVQLDASGNGSTTATAVDNGSNDACGIQSLVLSQTAFVCSEVGANTVTLTVTDNNDNVSTCTATVTVEDNVAPVAICQDVTVQLDASGNGSTTATAVDNGSNDACGIQSLALSQTAFVCSEVGGNTVTLTVTDNNNNVSTCTATVTVEDNVAPVAICQAVTVQLDASGNGSTTAAAVDNGSNDACGIQSLALSQTDFVCSEVGGNTVILTVTDVNNNVSTCTATVTVEDNVAPVAICQDVTVQLDASGNGSTTAVAVDNGSNDACGIQSLVLSQTDFVCGEVGGNTVTLTVTDVNNNVSTCTATVTVEDNVAPVAICQDVTVQLDASGNGSTTATAVDDGSNDACGIQSIALSQTDFVCSEVGGNTVTLTVTDVNNNVSTCAATVTVEDNIDPIAICQDVTVQLDASGNGSTTAAAVDNGSNDACGIQSLVLSQTAFVCSEVGSNTVTLTVTDVNNNVSTCTATVTVEDNVAPVAICQDVTVQLDASGNGSTTAAAVDNGSNDACGIQSLALSQTDFLCSEVGGNTVTLTVTDNNNNVSTCTATVTVEDNVAPNAVCKDISVTLDSTGNWTIIPTDVNGGSSDACGIASFVLDNSGFTCGDIGANTVTLTVTDNNSNVSSCTATVTVIGIVPVVSVTEDVLPIFCQGGTLILTANSDVPVQAYAWSTGETTQEIQVNADGPYTVDVTSWTGCVTTVTYTVSGYDPGALISAYTILAGEEVHLHGYQDVESGGVGVFYSGEKAKLHDEAMVADFVQADEIDIDDPSHAGSLIYSTANPLIPDFYYNTQPSSNDVKVNKDDNVVLTGCVYDKIEVKEDATITFTCDNIYIHELKTKKGVTINFAGSANMYIDKAVKIDKQSTFNPSGETVTIYVDDKFEVKEEVTFIGNVYSTKDIHAHGGNDNGLEDDDDYNAEKTTYMTGLFIAEGKVHGHKNVIWNMNTNCNPAPLPAVTISCDDCKGGVNLLQMAYNQVGPVYVEVTDKDGNDVYFADTVYQNDTISFEGTGSNNKLDKDIKVYVDGVLNATVHTSCSKPIGPGAVWGDFTVTYAESVDNGPVCNYYGGSQNNDTRIADAGSIVANTYPNPFVDVVTIEFAIPKPGKTVIEITTITGDVIRTVDFGVLEANKSYLYKFKPENQMIGGAFVYKISSGDQMATGKLIMVK